MSNYRFDDAARQRVADIFDTFFSGRPYESAPAKKQITVQDLVARKVSHVRLGEKRYRITCEEIEVGKKS